MSQSTPLVSILIPLYNAEEWIAETLESALGQTWSNTEIIVVDDGSTDESLSIARSYQSRGVNVVAQSNQGACAARNRAFREAEGDFIQYLDADDLMESRKIERQVRRLQREPERTVAYGAWGAFEDDPEQAHFPSSLGRQDFDDPVEWLLNWAHGKGGARPHAWLTPYSLVEEAGAWNEKLSVNQDGEFFARVLTNAQKIAYCPRATVYYRATQRGVSTKETSEKWWALLKSYRLIYDSVTSVRDSDEVDRAFAVLYKHMAFNAYPEYKEVAREAERRANDLWDMNWRFPEKNTHIRFLVRILGWKWARIVQWSYRNIFYF